MNQTLPIIHQDPTRPGLVLEDWQTPTPPGWCYLCGCGCVCRVGVHWLGDPQPVDPAELIATAARYVLLNEVLDDVADAELHPAMAARVIARLDRLITTFTARPVVSR